MKTLEISFCSGSDVLFSHLSNGHTVPTGLTRLQWVEGATQEHELDTFEGFLNALTGLRQLLVAIGDPGRMPKIPSITRHSRTLKVLEIQIGEFERKKPLSEPDMDAICSQCTELRQLAVTVPKEFMTEVHLSTAWRAFLVSSIQIPPNDDAH